jgi:hypothetical protein
MISFVERPDERILGAFARLRVSNDFQTVLAWLEKSRQNALEVLPKIDESISLTKLSGGVSILSEILSEISSAPDTLDKLERVNVAGNK